MHLAREYTEDHQRDVRFYNVYDRYQEAKENHDENMELKYAAFMELSFPPSHPFPNIIRGYYFNNLNRENPENASIFNEPVFDYSILDERIRKEFQCKTLPFYNRMNEIRSTETNRNRLNN
jgi:hypothetical protein